MKLEEAVGRATFSTGGFWFGIDHQMDIEGPDIRGRYFHAKNELQRSGERNPLPYGFHPVVGGYAKGKNHQVLTWRSERIHFVMNLIQMHEGEYRRWHFEWKGRMPELPHSDETDEWKQPAIGGRQPAIGSLLTHRQLQSGKLQGPPMTSQDPGMQMVWGPDSTIVQRLHHQFARDSPVAFGFVHGCRAEPTMHSSSAQARKMGGWVA